MTEQCQDVKGGCGDAGEPETLIIFNTLSATVQRVPNASTLEC